MSDLSHMSTADLKSEQAQLVADEKMTTQLLKAARVITSKYADIERNAIACTGLMVILFLITCPIIGIGYVAFDRLPSITSAWTIGWGNVVAIMVVIAIAARRKLDSASQLIANSSDKELASLNECKETLAVIQRKTLNAFIGIMLLAIASIGLLITAIVAS